MIANEHQVECFDMGCLPYLDALRLQQKLSEQRRLGRVPDRLLLLEHTPVFTTGRRDSSFDFLVSKEWIASQNIDMIKTDRGGLVTYHGPGQLVGYLIFQLNCSIPQLVWRIEEVLILLLHQFHIEGMRDDEHPGVWIDDRKIASIGLRIEKGITRHGFALNVTCDLRPFRYINPCGIQDRGVTSLEKELGWHPLMHDVKKHLLKKWSKVFGQEIHVEGTPDLSPE